MPSPETHFSRRPHAGAAVIIRSGLLLLYAMAGLSLYQPIFWTPRVGARAAFGQREQAGLFIS